MERRTAVTVLFVLSFVFIASAQKPKGMKPGVERWPIKTTAHHLNETPQDVTFAQFIALADPPGVTRNDPRYQDSFIPAFQNSLNLREGDMVRVSGWLHLVAYETDGDFHIQISNSPASGDSCIIVEVPYPTYVKTAAKLKKLCSAVRTEIKTDMLANKDPSTSGTVLKEAVHVTVAGQLFFDDSHVGDKRRGKKGMKAATLWEVHPMTSLVLQ